MTNAPKRPVHYKTPGGGTGWPAGPDGCEVCAAEYERRGRALDGLRVRSLEYLQASAGAPPPKTTTDVARVSCRECLVHIETTAREAIRSIDDREIAAADDELAADTDPPRYAAGVAGALRG